MLKHFVHYRAVTRVPLLVHDPRQSLSEGRNVETLVSTADLAPTLLALAGVPQFRGIQGRSLRPLLDGQCDVIRDALLIEEDQPFAPPGLTAPVRIRTVVTAQGRMTRYLGSDDELEIYDHRSDHDELVNIAGTVEAGALHTHLTEAMLNEVSAVNESGIGPTAAA